MHFAGFVKVEESVEKGELEQQINSTGDWNDDIESQFKELVEDFKKIQTF